MIHKIEVTAAISAEELRKRFRRSLMTGGAVIRIRDSADEAELKQLIDRFAPGAVEYNLNALVLEEVAKHPKVSPKLQEELQRVNIRRVRRALEKRSAESL